MVTFNMAASLILWVFIFHSTFGNEVRKDLISKDVPIKENIENIIGNNRELDNTDKLLKTTNKTKIWRGPLRQMFPQHEEIENISPRDSGKALFLTPLIKSGKIKEAQQAAKVELLGQDVKSYSGYLTVGLENCGSNLFFWFFPAMFNHDDNPVLLWLQGGPGGTSLFGLFNENGPFIVKAGSTLEPRATTWALTHNIIYIDNPVGTGYSFTNSCYVTTQKEVANDLYDALTQFFQLFPSLKKNDFYVTGESYAGKYIPAISHKIHTENKMKMKSRKPRDLINLKGLAIGDGLCDPETMLNYGDMLLNIGLIDQLDYKGFKGAEDIIRKLIQKKQWVQAFKTWDGLVNGDQTGHPSMFVNNTGFNYYFNYLVTKMPIELGYFQYFVQLPNIRKAIHVGTSKWNSGDEVEKHLLGDFMQSVKPWIEELLEQYKVLIYNGQLDVIIGWPLSDNFVRSLKWSGAQKFLNATREKWHVVDQLAGYSKTSNNFTQILVRNAGHMVPYDQPKWAFDMISRWVSGKTFK